MKNHNVLLAMHELDGVGWKTIRHLMNRYPELEDLIGASVEELRAAGLPPSKAELLSAGLTESYVQQVTAKYETGDIVPLTVESPEYPELLLQTSQPPWVIYTRGSIELLKLPTIAVVGTRTPTVYGKRMAESLCRDLSVAGICIVSGLAKGIDGIAHQGGLRGPGRTIGVLGCGIDVIYPKEHTFLYHEILEQGLLLSEYPPGMGAAPGMFPLRNRIIAGISLGTLVIEAALKSGSLITSDMALDESRDVFAVPGPVSSPKSAGTNRLIQNGAKLVTNADDLLIEYRHVIGWDPNRSGRTANTTPHGQILSPEEERVLALITEEPATIDDLVERLQTNFGHLHAILLSLQLKKRIEQLPGSVYVLI